MLIHVSLTSKKCGFRLPYKIRKSYPSIFVGSKPFNRLNQWSKDVEMLIAYDEASVYFETAEERLNFQLTWTIPPYN